MPVPSLPWKPDPKTLLLYGVCECYVWPTAPNGMYGGKCGWCEEPVDLPLHTTRLDAEKALAVKTGIPSDWLLGVSKKPVEQWQELHWEYVHEQRTLGLADANP